MNMRGLPAIQYYVSGGEINAIYDALFDRPADPEGMAHYAPLLANTSYEDAVKIIAGGARNQDIATEAEMQQAIADFNALMNKGEYGAAAAFASNAGVDPDVVANYVNENYGDRFGGTTVTADTVKQAAQNYDVIDLNLPTRPVQEPSVNLNTLGPSTTGATVVNQNPPIPADVSAKNLLDRTYRAVLDRDPTQAGYDYYLPKILSGEINEGNIISEVVGGARTGADLTAATNYALNTKLGEFSNLVSGGDYAGAKNLLDQTINQYGLDRYASYANIADYLNQNFPDLTAENRGIFTAQNIANANFPGFYGYAPSAISGLAAIPTPQQFLPGAALSQGRIDPYFLRTAAPPIATSPVTGQPQLQGPTGLFATPTTGAAPTAEGMAEGGMAKATPADLGSKFDISEFVDDQGRLVGGYSQPIRDEFGVIIGYEGRPYERDVVFGEELRNREAASQMTPEERARALLNMQVMSGRTGVSPTRGGLEGIEVRGPASRATPRYYPFAKGGLADIAQDLASKGRYGDTMVAHISPREAGLLKAMGGSGTINPETGLPEYFSLFPKKGIKLNLGPLGNIKIGAKSSNFIQAAIANAMGLPPPVYGAIRGAVTGNLMEGIQAGMTAYGMQGLQNAYGPDFMKTVQAPAPIDTVSVGSGGVNAGAVTSANVPITGTEAEFLAARPEFGQATTAALSDPSLQMTNAASGFPVGPEVATQSQIAAREALAYSPLSNPEVGGIENLGSPFETQAVSPQNAASASQGYLRGVVPTEYQEYVPDFMLDASGKALATGTILGTSLIGGTMEKQAAQRRQAGINAALAAEREKDRKRAFEIMSQYKFGYAQGGAVPYEAGGTTGPTGTPRDVVGTGDGMSDSVPADIEGVQEARLADGEFVIPADVVSDIGNGSSDAGSKKLYDMMDRIRMARHGTKEQPPEINAERMMPV